MIVANARSLKSRPTAVIGLAFALIYGPPYRSTRVRSFRLAAVGLGEIQLPSTARVNTVRACTDELPAQRPIGCGTSYPPQTGTGQLGKAIAALHSCRHR